MRAAREGGGHFAITTDPDKYIGQADFIYTGCLYYPGYFEEEQEARKKLFIPKYQVNQDLINRAPDHVKFMHYLPALRNVDVTDEVMDGPHSVVFDQAENRLYSEMAILAATVLPEIAQATEAEKADGLAEAEAFLKDRMQISMKQERPSLVA
ncbi:MAG: hypothetical protein GY883_00190 [Shimia sp.]|nr:hypothetical protein [Shimia sp.]